MKNIYRNILTKEIVFEEDAIDYAFNKLGIKKVEPLGENGEYTLEQLDFFTEVTEWYFQNWNEEELEDE